MFKCCLSMDRKVGVTWAEEFDVWVEISLRECQDARLVIPSFDARSRG